MKPEDIIPEIHRYREKLVRECRYDVTKLMEHFRQREGGREAKGHRLVSFVESVGKTEPSYALHDKPPRKKK